jgi:hypothetical protein
MGRDIMIVGTPEAIASNPSGDMYTWISKRWHKYAIPYVWLDIKEKEILQLEEEFAQDPVGQMLLSKLHAMQEAGYEPPYTIELMISF